MMHDVKAWEILGVTRSDLSQNQRRRGHTGPMPKLSSAPASWQGVEWLPLAGIKNLGLELGDGRQVHQHEKPLFVRLQWLGLRVSNADIYLLQIEGTLILP